MTYSYKEVETALARVFAVSASKHGAFRGRIKNFQRLGLAPTFPGRGKRVVYSFEDAARWAFALELAHFGLDPLVLIQVASDIWPMVKPGAVQSSCGLLAMEPSVVSCSGNWASTARMTDRVGASRLALEWKRAMVINLEGLYSRLREALNETAEKAA